MRELTTLEIDQVGGGSISNFAADGGALGSVVGAVMYSTIAGAVRGGAIGALAGATYGIAYYTTGWIIESLS